jgi:hypothetical protein
MFWEQKKRAYLKPPTVKMGGLSHIGRHPMRVRALAPMRCNAHEIERSVEARYYAVDAITFGLYCTAIGMSMPCSPSVGPALTCIT